MNKIYHGDIDYHHQKNKNNSVSLIETDTGLPLVTYTTDYKVYEIPSCELIGRINYEGDYLVFSPTVGKPLRPYRLTVTSENIILFHVEISKWWLNLNRPIKDK